MDKEFIDAMRMWVLWTNPSNPDEKDVETARLARRAVVKLLRKYDWGEGDG
jgi:hypothetical protein